MAFDQGSFDDLKELAQRLLSHPFPDGPASVEILVGRLPQSAAIDLPIPDGGRLLGSAAHTVDQRPMLVTAELAGEGSPNETLSSYELKLGQAGWSRFEGFGGPRGGFVPSGVPGLGHSYRRGNEGPLLMVSFTETADRLWNVRLRLDWNMPRHIGSYRGGGPAGAERIPPLTAPPHSNLQPRGGGGGDGTWNSYATLKTAMQVTEIEAHFAEQLTHAGWRRLVGTADDMVAWSSWVLPGDGEWRGVLLVVAPFGNDQRSLTLQIESAERWGGSGWSASSTAFLR